MNFFQAQDNARRKTGQLMLIFGIAVVVLIVLTNILVAFFIATTGDTLQVTTGGDVFASLPMDVWIWTSLGVIGAIAAASLFKYRAVSGGGRSIGEALGGRQINHNTTNHGERRLLNVVEEMAIASGMPVPPVYLIPEPSINAFAAGFTTDDAIIGINQGTIDHLTRDELQGVVAHEFSHILNGDTNINLRLIAILHGILFIGIVGYGILRMGGLSRKNGAPLMLMGLGLVIIGFSGTFFGNLIKAGVSRQREYLADSASVQFTRNPDGIGEALKKIGGLSHGSTMRAANAQEVSHMFFGQSRELFLNRLMSTHPPLEQRIRAIQPNWDGKFPSVDETISAESMAPDHPSVQGFASTSATVQASPDQLVDAIGTTSQEALTAARVLIDSTDAAVRRAADDPWAARALVYAMLLDHDDELRAHQFTFIEQAAENGVPQHVMALWQALEGADEQHRLMLLELTVPTLKELSHQQYQRFIANAVALIKADNQIDLFEWVLHRVLTKELKPHFEGLRRVRARYQSTDKLPNESAVLLSALARVGRDELADQQQAYAEGASVLQLSLPMHTDPDPNFESLNDALEKLRRLKPLAKPKLIKALAATVLADGHVTPREGALLHGVAATLDCPLPPSIYAQR
ncbi:MAG: M48 family metallopeptidase [Gammaproteobacteria bacterium]|nr:M48 family metallopeptidase [Gammaproteobacteria bacterium]